MTVLSGDLAVPQSAGRLFCFPDGSVFAFGDAEREELFPEVVDGYIARMHEVGGIEAIVPEFVHHELPCGEVVG